MYLVKQTYENMPEYLKSGHYQNISCTVSDEGVKADEHSRKYVHGGTILDGSGKAVKITRIGPSGNYKYSLSAEPAGILFATVEVTHGQQPGALMIDGSVNTERLQGEYAVEALQQLIPKMPHIKFFVDDKLALKEEA